MEELLELLGLNKWKDEEKLVTPYVVNREAIRKLREKERLYWERYNLI